MSKKAFAKTHYEKPAPGDAILVELDEMWHYVTSKKQVMDMEASRRETGKIVDWECGGRDKVTLSKLMERDKWGIYSEAIAVDKLYTEQITNGVS